MIHEYSNLPNLISQTVLCKSTYSLLFRVDFQLILQIKHGYVNVQ